MAWESETETHADGTDGNGKVNGINYDEIYPSIIKPMPEENPAADCDSSEDILPSKDLTEQAPNDNYSLVYMIVMLNGIGVLLPWNMFITIAPQYYVDFWFTDNNGTESHWGKSFMSALGITAQIPNVLLAIVSVLSLIQGPIMYRIAGSLCVNCLNVVVILILVIVQQPTEDAQKWFYIVSLSIVMIMNASNGLYQNSIFGVAADFPFKYTNAVVVGTNICGTFTSVISILTTVAFPSNYKLIALIYFSISLGTLLVCAGSLVVMSRLPFYQFYAERGAAARKAEGNATRPSIKQYWETFLCCWPQMLNVFLVYFVTLSVFPTVLVGIDIYPGMKNAFPDNIYQGVATFLNFNLFAALGSTAANFIQFPNRNFLFIPVTLRLLFIPYFMLCYYDTDRTMYVLFENQWWFIIGNTIMAFSSGYLSSLGLMYSPSGAPSHLQKTAGQLAALCLVIGIMAGVSFTPVITTIVEHIGGFNPPDIITTTTTTPFI